MFNKFVVFLFKIFEKQDNLKNQIRVKYYEINTKQSIKFVKQGEGTLTIIGDFKNFKIGKNSHLKSNTFIESSGGVTIGNYFHTGRNLTIFSTNHNYNSKNKIPYDEVSFEQPVVIENFVWCGSNVTIVPGVKIGEGSVVAAGSVITKDVPKFSIVGGNPAKIIKYRDIKLFNILKEERKYF